MADVVGMAKFFTELIGGSNDAFDAFTYGISVHEKNNGDQACIGGWFHS